MQKLLKLGLLSFVGLLFSYVGFMASAETSYAMSSKLLLEIGLLPGLSVDVLPDSTPTPTPTPAPTPTLRPQVTSTAQVSPELTSAVYSGPPPVKAMPTTYKPTRTSIKPHHTTVATTGGAAIPVLITIHLPNAKNLNIKIYKLFFILGVIAPLFLISVATLWLLIKWRLKQRKQARQNLVL